MLKDETLKELKSGFSAIRKVAYELLEQVSALEMQVAMANAAAAPQPAPAIQLVAAQPVAMAPPAIEDTPQMVPDRQATGFTPMPLEHVRLGKMGKSVVELLNKKLRPMRLMDIVSEICGDDKRLKAQLQAVIMGQVGRVFNRVSSGVYGLVHWDEGLSAQMQPHARICSIADVVEAAKKHGGNFTPKDLAQIMGMPSAASRINQCLWGYGGGNKKMPQKFCKMGKSLYALLDHEVLPRPQHDGTDIDDTEVVHVQSVDDVLNGNNN